MIVTQTIGLLQYQCIVGEHEGSDNPTNRLTVTGPGLAAPAQYTMNEDQQRRRGKLGAERTGQEAIRYTVNNIILPIAIGRLHHLQLLIDAIECDDDGVAMLDGQGLAALRREAGLVL